MIKFSAQNALVHYVSDVIEIPSKTGGQPFCKRELVINDSWERDGQQYLNFVLIEFSGDKMQHLNGIDPGQRVNIEGMLVGREYNNRIFNTVRGLSVSIGQPQPYGSASMPRGFPQQHAFQTPQQQSGYYGQSQQQYAQSAAQFGPSPRPGGFPQQQNAQSYPQQDYPQAQPQPPADINSRAYRPTTVPGKADLPFHN